MTLTGVFLGAAFGTDPAYTSLTVLLGQAARGEIEIEKTFPLADAAGAHRHLTKNQNFGRGLLIP